MKQTTHIVGIVAVLSFTLLSNAMSMADTPFEKAMAAVAVARVALSMADERPQLQDSERPNPHPRSLDGSLKPLIDPSTPTRTSADKGLHEGALSGKDVHTILGPSASMQPMRIEMTTGEVISDVLPAQLVIGGWQQGCAACLRQKREIQTQLTPLNWTVGNSPSDQIQFTQIPMTESAPQVTLFQNGIEIKRWQGYQDPGMLSRELRVAWDSAPPLKPMQASNMNGCSIHAKRQIRQAIQCVKTYVGEGNSSSLVWDRNGSRGISLLAHGDWSAKSIFGTEGRIELLSPNAVKLTTRQFAFGYRLRGSDVTIDPDPITLRGLADQMSLMESQAVGAIPSQFIGLDDALEIYWCIQMFRDVFSLLRPSADIRLPDQVVANAVLKGETLTVSFDTPLTVRLVWLFTFDLVVKRVVITEHNVHIDFSGSRLVKERDFAVK